MGDARPGDDFEAFADRVWEPLRQALVGALGIERGAEAHAQAMAYAWQHSDRVMAMSFPVSYLFKVGRSRTRNRRKVLTALYAEPPKGSPEFEPGLGPALARLSEKQRTAVFLVVGCRWRYVEVAELTGKSESSVRALVERGLARLRDELNVEES